MTLYVKDKFQVQKPNPLHLKCLAMLSQRSLVAGFCPADRMDNLQEVHLAGML
ncbi:hypothetical protein VIBNIPon4_710005 [Vibrio nigripulchritudo POn4]|nr:hypothetical protein VIBNIFTn2_300005 [Vibrio nigripulchritudo FTn2]CCN67164.1 hypothetical protein VIBNIPon4_710005 [Vibrio nigripulchritudo POn4]